MYNADKNRGKAMNKYNKQLSETEKPQAAPVVLGPTADGAFGQYMLGQLNSLAKFSKVDQPLHNQFMAKQGKEKEVKKGKNDPGANVRIVDAAGMAADGEEGDGLIQGMFDNQPFTDDQIKEAFFTFDMNGNGYIGVAEIRFVLDALGEDVTDEEIDEMVRMLDVDGDGQVNFKEFYKMASGQSLAPIGVALPPPRDMEIAQRLGKSMSSKENSIDKEKANKKLGSEKLPTKDVKGRSDGLKKKEKESPQKGKKGKDDDYVIDEEGEEEEEYEDEEDYEEEEEYEDEQAEEEGDLKKEKFEQLGYGKKEKDKEDSLDRLVAAAGNLKGKVQLQGQSQKTTPGDAIKTQSHKDLTRLRNEQ